MNIFETTVSENTVNHLDMTLDVALRSKNVIENNQIHTRNGFQTFNLIEEINNSAVYDINCEIPKYVEFVYGNNLAFFQTFIDHIHGIKYDVGGYQEYHRHISTEDIGFIIYLNDSDGSTRFYDGKDIIDIVPAKNKMILFDSSIWHEGLKCTKEKRVIVGSVRFNYKVWQNRIT